MRPLWSYGVDAANTPDRALTRLYVVLSLPTFRERWRRPLSTSAAEAGP
jgi:hypothetical protein